MKPFFQKKDKKSCHHHKSSHKLCLSKLEVRLRAFLLSLSLLFTSHLLASGRGRLPFGSYSSIYPDIYQKIEETSFYAGDEKGRYLGDFVVTLSDGSKWKICVGQNDIYLSWAYGDIVRVALRRDYLSYFESHPLLLVNETRKNAVKTFLLEHKTEPLTVTGVDFYRKGLSTLPGAAPSLREEPPKRLTSDLRKVIVLNDGSRWVIKDHFSELSVGTRVYVGAQGFLDYFYDFVLISGTGPNASAILARPQDKFTQLALLAQAKKRVLTDKFEKSQTQRR